MKQKQPPTKELTELKGKVADRKLDQKIYAAARAGKKAAKNK